MKKNSAIDFYFKVSLWTFFCLGLVQIIYTFKTIGSAGNESDALDIISKINRLQTQYAKKHDGKFAPNFDELDKTEYLSENLGYAPPKIRGYAFKMKVEEPTSQKPAFYSISADPLEPKGFNQTGIKHFYFDSIIGRVKATEENRPANAADPSI
jgi:hypothetical protein